MMENQTLFERHLALRWLFVLGVVFIPFDAVGGVSALGELGNELSFPFLGAAIALAAIINLASGTNRFSSSLALKIGAGIIGVILLSWLVNMESIASAIARERTGANKFATSFMVVLYGIGLAWLAEQLEERDIRGLLLKAVAVSAAIVTFYALFELAGRQGPLSGLYNAVDGLVHRRQNDVINAWNGSVNLKVLYDWDPRLRSVSFEPPAFGNFCGLAWPWVWFAAVTAKRERQLRYWAVLIAFTLIVAVGQSRTGMLILAVDMAVIVALRFLYAPRRSVGDATVLLRAMIPFAAVLTLLAGIAYVSLQSQQIVANVVGGDSVSNLSRLAFQVAALHLFFAHPIFGVGLGQFGFYAANYLPDWAFRSPEIPPMLAFPTAPWPSIYSLYGRLGAELGVIGLIGWISMWLTLALRLTRSARDRASELRGYGLEYPLVASVFGVLTSGIASETFRTPMFWITLGCCCGFLRARRAATTTDAPLLRPSTTPASAPALHHSR